MMKTTPFCSAALKPRKNLTLCNFCVTSWALSGNSLSRLQSLEYCMISEVYAPYYRAAGTLDTNLEIQLTTGEWEVHYIEK